MSAIKLVAIIAGVLVVGLLGFGMVISATPEGKDRAAERRAIDSCREQQNDELQDLEVRRFIRSACNKMEADFRRKWGRDP